MGPHLIFYCILLKFAYDSENLVAIGNAPTVYGAIGNAAYTNGNENTYDS